MNVVLLGRFPPPIDGQSLATKRLGDLLDDVCDVRKIDTQPGNPIARREQGISPGRLLHFARLRRIVEEALPEDPRTLVLWPAISPDLSGHLRDRFAVLPAMRRFDRVFAIAHRGNFEKLFRSRLTQSSSQRLVLRMRGFVFLTEGLSRRCSRWIPADKRFVIPNTIDADVLFTDEEVAVKQRLRQERTSIRLLFLSNMIRSKGYLDVLESTRLLRQREIEIEAQFVGAWKDDSERIDFERRVAETGLSSVVRHLGPIADRRHIKDLYSKSDVLILPTYYPNEAQPLVIIEALNAGVPVVATRHGGIPEMIAHDREGLLVPPRQTDAIVDAVLQLSKADAWLERSRAARRRFQQNYSPKLVRDQWQELVQRETDAATGLLDVTRTTPMQ